MGNYQFLKIIIFVIATVLSSCEGRKFIDIPIQKVEQEIFEELQARQTLAIDSINRNLYKEVYDNGDIIYTIDIYSSENNQQIISLLDSEESKDILKKILSCFRKMDISINRFYIHNNCNGNILSYKVLPKDSIVTLR